MYAIEIQMYTEQKNNKKLKQLYQRALTIKSAIPHPRIMGIIRECGGKMHMAERMWTQAHTDFFEVRLPLTLLCCSSFTPAFAAYAIDHFADINAVC